MEETGDLTMPALRIAMWSGPRSISTALMRSFENRPDTFVTDEPFYAHYLHKTGIQHPLREEVMAEGNIDWNNAADEITGPIPEGKAIWYQKHMAQHNLAGYGMKWVEKLTNCILIRHPREVMLSYLIKYEISEKNKKFNIFFDGNSQNLKGWSTEDIYKNNVEFLIINLKTNIPTNNKLFNIPSKEKL